MEEIEGQKHIINKMQGRVRNTQKRLFPVTTKIVKGLKRIQLVK
jgi:hypothetical protein